MAAVEPLYPVAILRDEMGPVDDNAPIKQRSIDVDQKETQGNDVLLIKDILDRSERIHRAVYKLYQLVLSTDQLDAAQANKLITHVKQQMNDLNDAARQLADITSRLGKALQERLLTTCLWLSCVVGEIVTSSESLLNPRTNNETGGRRKSWMIERIRKTKRAYDNANVNQETAAKLTELSKQFTDAMNLWLDRVISCECLLRVRTRNKENSTGPTSSKDTVVMPDYAVSFPVPVLPMPSALQSDEDETQGDTLAASSSTFVAPDFAVSFPVPTLPVPSGLSDKGDSNTLSVEMNFDAALKLPESIRQGLSSTLYRNVDIDGNTNDPGHEKGQDTSFPRPLSPRNREGEPSEARHSQHSREPTNDYVKPPTQEKHRNSETSVQTFTNEEMKRSKGKLSERGREGTEQTREKSPTEVSQATQPKPDRASTPQPRHPLAALVTVDTPYKIRMMYEPSLCKPPRQFTDFLYGKMWKLVRLGRSGTPKGVTPWRTCYLKPRTKPENDKTISLRVIKPVPSSCANASSTRQSLEYLKHKLRGEAVDITPGPVVVDIHIGEQAKMMTKWVLKQQVLHIRVNDTMQLEIASQHFNESVLNEMSE